MTKSRKIYVGILIIATASLIFDRAVLRRSASEPQTSQARSVPFRAPEDTGAAALGEKSLGPQHPLPVSPVNPDMIAFTEIPSVEGDGSILLLKNTLRQVLGAAGIGPGPPDGPGATRDLFAASDEFLSATRISPPPSDEQKTLPPPVMSLHLTGILIGPVNRWAVINNEVLFCGQNIGPYKVLEIHPEQAILALQSERIILFLDR